MAAPDFSLRTIVYVNKTGTDDAGYNIVGQPAPRLTIAQALLDLADPTLYPAASALTPHVIAVGPGTYATPAFALPPFTFVVGDPDGPCDPTQATLLSLSGNITLGAAWNLNQTAFGGLMNLTIRQTTSQNIDLTTPVPAAGTPARRITLRNVRTDADNVILLANGAGDIWDLRNVIQDGASNDAVIATGGTLFINGLQSEAPVSIRANAIAMVAQAYGIFITNAASGLTCAALAATNCTVRLGCCDLRALTLNEVAAGVLAVSADCASIPLVAAITFQGTATNADLIRTSDSGGSGTAGTFTGLNGQTIVGNALGSWVITANGTNQNVELIPSGSGFTRVVQSAATAATGNFALNVVVSGTLDSVSLGNATAYAWLQSFNSRPLVLNPIGSNVLIGTIVNTGGLLQIGTNTTTPSGGMLFGTDVNLYRSAAAVLATDQSLRVIGNFYFSNGSAASPSIASFTDLTSGIYRPGANQLGFSTNGTNAGIIDATQNWTFAGNIAVSAQKSVALGLYTVAQLPTAAAGNRGWTAYVNDSNAVSFTAGIGAIVAAGGATVVPVFSDGANWLIG